MGANAVHSELEIMDGSITFKDGESLYRGTRTRITHTSIAGSFS